MNMLFSLLEDPSSGTPPPRALSRTRDYDVKMPLNTGIRCLALMDLADDALYGEAEAKVFLRHLDLADEELSTPGVPTSQGHTYVVAVPKRETAADGEVVRALESLRRLGDAAARHVTGIEWSASRLAS